jgi:hypothetical protein
MVTIIFYESLTYFQSSIVFLLSFKSSLSEDFIFVIYSHSIKLNVHSLQGYVEGIKGLVQLGLLDPNPAPVLHENGK